MRATIESKVKHGIITKEAGNNVELKAYGESTFLDRFAQHLPWRDAVEEMLMLGKIAGPIAMTSALIFSKSIISMIFLGRMGKIELAGGSLAMAFANITGFSVMKGLAMAMDPICCQAYGAKRWSVISQTYLKTFVLLLIASLPIAFLWLNVGHVFLWLGQDRDITRVAKIYLIFSLPELLTQAHLYPLRSFLMTQGLNFPSSVVSVIVTVLHPPIVYFLVVYLNLGVKGIALSSVCYTFNSNIGLLIYVVLSKSAIKPWEGLTLTSFFQGWWSLLSLALPTLCSVCLEWWWYEIILFLGGLLSNAQSCVAAMGVLIQTTGTIYVIPFSLSLGVSQRVGHELGAGEPTRAQRAATVGTVVALCYGFVAFLGTCALKPVWGKFYTDDPQTLALITTALPILGLAEIGNAPQTAAAGALMGSARPKVGAHINVTAFYLVGLPVSVISAFIFKVGFLGLWWGLVAAQYSCLWMMLNTLYQTNWKVQAKRAEELTLTVGNEEDVDTKLVP